MTARRIADIATEVTFEDGRKGVHRGARRDPRHADLSRCPRAALEKAA